MGRLIDADAFIEYANRKLDLFTDELRTMIEEQPTAYDVEKVVEELEDLEEDFCQCFEKCEEQCFIQRVTDIVKRGGVE